MRILEKTNKMKKLKKSNMFNIFILSLACTVFVQCDKPESPDTSLLLLLEQVAESNPNTISAGDIERIINGTPVTNNRNRVVRLNSNGSGCTGTLLMNNWVLTAEHCVDATRPTGTTARLDNTTLRSVDVITHPTLDVAVVELGGSFTIDGSTTAYNMPIYSGTNASLQNLTLICQGFGRNTYTGGFGTLREANLQITATNATTIRTGVNGANQIQWSGDSGGTCFFRDAQQVRYITGVNSTCNHTQSQSRVNFCTQIGPQAYRNWVMTTIAGIRNVPLNIVEPAFHSGFYLAHYGDLRNAFGTNQGAALNHWNAYGKKEGRRASTEFDVKYYLARYADLRKAYGTNYAAAYNHWIAYGRKEGRRGSLEFDVKFYLNRYGDLKNAFGTNYPAAINHWVNNGVSEGRQGSADFDVQYYRSQYGDLRNAFGSDWMRLILHWVVSGKGEGRQGVE